MDALSALCLWIGARQRVRGSHEYLQYPTSRSNCTHRQTENPPPGSLRLGLYILTPEGKARQAENSYSSPSYLRDDAVRCLSNTKGLSLYARVFCRTLLDSLNEQTTSRSVLHAWARHTSCLVSLLKMAETVWVGSTGEKARLRSLAGRRSAQKKRGHANWSAFVARLQIAADRNRRGLPSCLLFWCPSTPPRNKFQHQICGSTFDS